MSEHHLLMLTTTLIILISSRKISIHVYESESLQGTNINFLPVLHEKIIIVITSYIPKAPAVSVGKGTTHIFISYYECVVVLVFM